MDFAHGDDYFDGECVGFGFGRVERRVKTGVQYLRFGLGFDYFVHLFGGYWQFFEMSLKLKIKN
jgi:hypothetical protein